MEARELWAGLQLLDRQILDRDGYMAGNVDDLEIERTPDTGELHVTAVLSGPGALAGRFGWRRLSSWLWHIHQHERPAGHEPRRIPLRHVADIGDHVTVSLGREEMGSALTEHWVREHVIAHIPGSRHAAE